MTWQSMDSALDVLPRILRNSTNKNTCHSGPNSIGLAGIESADLLELKSKKVR